MTVKVSPYKASKILRCFFQGTPQPEIAKKCSVNQGTVSRYASRLKEDADNSSIIAAAKEYGIMHEVDSLRSLAVELWNNKLTVEEAQEGVSILKLFDSLGVQPAEHETLIKVIPKLKKPEFISAAKKLEKLEATTGKTYSELVSQFEQLSSEITQLQQTDAMSKQESEGLQQSIKELTAAKKKAEQEQSDLEAEVAKKMREANLTLDRIKKLEPVAKALKKLSVSDDKLDIYIKEHQELEELGIGWGNFKVIVEGMKGDS